MILVFNGTLIPSFDCFGTVSGAACEPIVDAAVLINGDEIVEAGDLASCEIAMAAQHQPVERLDARGGLIIPGLINLHHHFYSALARGFAPRLPCRDFHEILTGLWWPLDRSLTDEAVRLSALLAALDSIRHGCTTVIDHHAGPGSVDGSLDIIADSVRQAGIRAGLCYEISDRDGSAAAQAGLNENLRFAARCRDQRAGDLRALLGLHASFTVSNEMLGQAGRAGLPCHVHIAESPVDTNVSQACFGASPLARFRDAGVLRTGALLAHGVHLGDDDCRELVTAGASLAHCPESNLNNGVGLLDIDRPALSGATIGVGSDGFFGSMLSAVRAGVLAGRGVARDPTRGFAAHSQLLAANARYCAALFGLSGLGRINQGAPADLAVIADIPPTPLSSTNAFGHLVYGFAGAPVRHTVGQGRVLLRDFELTFGGGEELAASARAAAESLWCQIVS